MRELAIIEDGAMLIADGKIEWKGTTDELRRVLAQEKLLPVIDARGCVVTPGFVDAHTHMVFAGSRAAEFEQRIEGKTYQQIAAAGGGIANTVRATRNATAEELLMLARRHAEWFLRNGTTTVEVKSGYGLSLDAELKILGVIRSLAKETPLRIVATLLAAHTIPPEFQQDRAGYIALVVREIVPRVQQEKLARFCDVFCDEHAFTIAESRRDFIRGEECWARAAHACGTIRGGWRSSPGGGAGRGDGGSSGVHRCDRNCCAGKRIGAAGTGAGFRVLPGSRSLPECSRHAGCRACSRAGDGLQPGLIADNFDAIRDVAGMPADEDVAVGGAHGSDDQRCIQSWSRGRCRLARSGEGSGFFDPRIS